MTRSGGNNSGTVVQQEKDSPQQQNGAPALSFFGADNAGARACAFDVDGITVLVRHWDSRRNDDVAAIAAELARARSEVSAKTLEVAALTARVRAEEGEPARLLGTGYVRFEGGSIWVLNNRERGFGHFGYRFNNWDELFRLLDVKVTGHGQDEHGLWWSVENARKEPRHAR
jgi:hypothetical protein